MPGRFSYTYEWPLAALKGWWVVLLKIGDVRDLFRCPRCRGPLRGDAAHLRCETSSCALSVEEFVTASSIPVLVDFERSVLQRSALISSSGASPVTRRRRAGVVGQLRRRVLKPHLPTEQNIGRLLEVAAASNRRVRVLVVGGGTVGDDIDAIYRRDDVEVVAFDVYASPHVQFIADGHQIPLADEAVDAVIVQAVLEHVKEPAVIVAEMHRVLRQGGVVYSETPFLQQVHEGAFDFSRFTESGHLLLFQQFERIDSGVIGGPGTQLLWSLDHFARGAFRSRTAGMVTKLAFAWLPWTDAMFDRKYSSDDASATYVLARKSASPAPFDVVGEYHGAQS